MSKQHISFWIKNSNLPTKRNEDAGYDIYPCFENDYIFIPSNTTKLIPTGIACAVSDDYYLQIQERGSTGALGIKYGAGVIDSGYRGEIQVVITNVNNRPLCITKKSAIDSKMDVIRSLNAIIYPYEKAIAQIVVHKLPKMSIEVIDYNELLKIDSERKDGLLGSSGK